jgi:hypothetical protein
MKGYCVKCKEKRDMVAPKKEQAKNGRWMMKGSCAVCKTKMFRFISDADAKKKGGDGEELDIGAPPSVADILGPVSGGKKNKKKGGDGEELDIGAPPSVADILGPVGGGKRKNKKGGEAEEVAIPKDLLSGGKRNNKKGGEAEEVAIPKDLLSGGKKKTANKKKGGDDFNLAEHLNQQSLVNPATRAKYAQANELFAPGTVIDQQVPQKTLSAADKQWDALRAPSMGLNSWNASNTAVALPHEDMERYRATSPLGGKKKTVKKNDDKKKAVKKNDDKKKK